MDKIIYITILSLYSFGVQAQLVQVGDFKGADPEWGLILAAWDFSEFKIEAISGDRFSERA